MIDSANLVKIGAILSDQSAPMKARYRALFTLKNLGGKEAIDIISRHFTDASALLKHELAYCLGQMQDDYALEMLRNVVKDENQAVIVRHEAAEALGAIGNPSDLPLLKQYSTNCPIELAETCQIAADRIEWLINKSKGEVVSANPFHSVDPAPPLPVEHGLSVKELVTQLMDDDLSLFNRYRALFTLRNMNNEEGVIALSKGLKAKSALFRHEIAYVFGQLSHPSSEPSLTASLNDHEEHDMVRHECAEALGSVGTESCMETLKGFLDDKERIVRESCEVALDMAEYGASDEFQYANGLQIVS